jgi:hypothetical protein
LLKPFYERRDGRFIPTSATIGPWDPRLQHGSPLAALIATHVEADKSPLRIAQLTLHFLGPVGLEPLDVQHTVVRPGKKIALSSVTVAGARPLLEAEIWRVAVAEEDLAPAIHVEPAPPLPEARAIELFPGVPSFGYGESLEWRFVSGSFAELGPATVWSRLLVPVVGDEPPSPVARMLAMVDSANGISAELDVRRWLFVPVSLTVSLARVPTGEWMGMSARTVIVPGGGGTTTATLFDEKGTVGEALQTLFVEKRRVP